MIIDNFYTLKNDLWLGKIGFLFYKRDLMQTLFWGKPVDTSIYMKIGITLSIEKREVNGYDQLSFKFCTINYNKISREITTEECNDIPSHTLIYISQNGVHESLEIAIPAGQLDLDLLNTTDRGRHLRICLFRKHQIEFIADNSDLLVFSGMKVKYGLLPFKYERKSYEIEADEEYYNFQLIGNEADNSTFRVEDLEMPSLEIGAPCPPVWYNKIKN
jgi:hypothetical protein